MPSYLEPPLVLAGRPGIIGIVNITQDSFYDGGRFLAAEDALAHAAELFAAWQGADYIRTHDVAALRDALMVLNAVATQAGPAAPDQGSNSARW
jgi:dihydropteroate synthase